MGKFLGLVHMQRSTARKTRQGSENLAFIKPEGGVIMRHPLGKMLKIMILCLVTGYKKLTKRNYKENVSFSSAFSC